jgi:hypothetical protein
MERERSATYLIVRKLVVVRIYHRQFSVELFPRTRTTITSEEDVCSHEVPS